MTAASLYRTPIAPEWIDYNGHVRDAYYGLIVSYATDALMDDLGIDATYRERTGCTLYTLESHVHYLSEIKQSDIVSVSVRLLAADEKRMHAAFDLTCEGRARPAASAESLLLHVHQGTTVSTRAFPSEIAAAIGALRRSTAGLGTDVPGSRCIELRPHRAG
ncbi:MAG TPA: thioesterase family protein [Steroidobacteraceae bacterium]|nr:thioesterase family protein [Steroidobacteraceae bacterium]